MNGVEVVRSYMDQMTNKVVDSVRHPILKGLSVKNLPTEVLIKLSIGEGFTEMSAEFVRKLAYLVTSLALVALNLIGLTFGKLVNGVLEGLSLRQIALFQDCNLLNTVIEMGLVGNAFAELLFSPYRGVQAGVQMFLNPQKYMDKCAQEYANRANRDMQRQGYQELDFADLEDGCDVNVVNLQKQADAEEGIWTTKGIDNFYPSPLSATDDGL